MTIDPAAEERRFRRELAGSAEHAAWKASLELPRVLDLHGLARRAGNPVSRLLLVAVLQTLKRRASALRFVVGASRFDVSIGGEWRELVLTARRLAPVVAWHIKEWSRLPVGLLDGRWESGAHLRVAPGKVVHHRVHFLPDAGVFVLEEDTKLQTVVPPRDPARARLWGEAVRCLDAADDALDGSDLDLARTKAARVLAIGEELADAGGPIVPLALDVLLEATEDPAEARRLGERIVRTCEAEFGAVSPRTAEANLQLAWRDAKLGRLDEAAARFFEVLGALERSYGPRTLESCRVLDGLAYCATAHGDREAAAELARRAAAVEDAYTASNRGWTHGAGA